MKTDTRHWIFSFHPRKETEEKRKRGEEKWQQGFAMRDGWIHSFHSFSTVQSMARSPQYLKTQSRPSLSLFFSPVISTPLHDIYIYIHISWKESQELSRAGDEYRCRCLYTYPLTDSNLRQTTIVDLLTRISNTPNITYTSLILSILQPTKMMILFPLFLSYSFTSSNTNKYCRYSQNPSPRLKKFKFIVKKLKKPKKYNTNIHILNLLIL